MENKKYDVEKAKEEAPQAACRGTVGGGLGMSEGLIYRKLDEIHKTMKEILDVLQQQQQPQFSQVGYYVGGCDHQWVPTESQYTGPVTMHCAKCGAIRA